MKIIAKRIFIAFLSIFIGVGCATKKTLNEPTVDANNILNDTNDLGNIRTDINQTDISIDNNGTDDLLARVKYLEELLNAYQAQSLALENPMSFFSKKVLLTNGSMLYGNITFQDDNIVQLETLIGALAIEKNTIIRVVDQAVSVLDNKDQMIEINAQHDIEQKVDGSQKKYSAEVVLLGDFKEIKDENQNTILSGQVKNIGSTRADFVKIIFTIYRNQSYDSMPVEYTAFINGASVAFDNNVISNSSLYKDEAGEFTLVIPSDFGPFISYTYRLDWAEYE